MFVNPKILYKMFCGYRRGGSAAGKTGHLSRQSPRYDIVAFKKLDRQKRNVAAAFYRCWWTFQKISPLPINAIISILPAEDLKTEDFKTGFRINFKYVVFVF